MRIQSHGLIVGQPALTRRKLLKQERGTIAPIAELLERDLFKAKQVFCDLWTQGYIDSFDSLTTSNGDDESWQTALKGNALAPATARKAITRQTVDRVVQELLKCVKQINACDDGVYRIRQVMLLGRYLRDTPRLGDVDLSVVLAFRSPDAHKPDGQSQERMQHALREGKSFDTVVEQATWPWRDIFHILKAGFPSFSFHDEKMAWVSRVFEGSGFGSSRRWAYLVAALERRSRHAGRKKAGHYPVCRCDRIHGAGRGPRCGGRPRLDGPLLRAGTSRHG